MIISRLRILEFIEAREAVTALEISHALHMTPANVRHHLSILLKEGSIRIFGFRSGHTRGRPKILYCSEKWASRNNLDQLVHALMTELFREADGKEKEDQLLQRIASHFIPTPNHSVKNLTKLLNALIAHLNLMNYQARWEAHVRAPKVVFQHCPYKSVLQKHPELCQMDRILLEKYLSGRAVQTERLSISESGKPHCVFFIYF